MKSSSAFEQNSKLDGWMLVFDLNSLVTVLISRKLGSLCNVTSHDLQMEENLPNLCFTKKTVYKEEGGIKMF